MADLRSEIDRVISELGHVESISFDVPQKYHSAIQGPNNTTLNVLVGEQKSTAVSFGPGDKITVRGPKHELVRVKKDIESLVKRAETEDVETIHVSAEYFHVIYNS